MLSVYYDLQGSGLLLFFHIPFFFGPAGAIGNAHNRGQDAENAGHQRSEQRRDARELSRRDALVREADLVAQNAGD